MVHRQWRRQSASSATNTGGKNDSTFPHFRAAVAVFIVTSSSIVHAATVDIIATDLANSRGIAIGPAGRVLVGEVGVGGPPISMTGHVSEVSHGQVRRLLTLPSFGSAVLYTGLEEPGGIAVD